MYSTVSYTKSALPKQDFQ